MSRSFDDLHHEMRVLVGAWLDKCQAAGLDVLVYCTARTEGEQAQLFARGRTASQIESAGARLAAIGHPEGKVLLDAVTPEPNEQIVTKAPPGLSYHHPQLVNGSRGAFAIDFVPMVNGKPQWTDGQLYMRAAKLAEELGLEWAGRWQSFRETAHLQLDHHGLVELRNRIRLWRGA